MLFWRGKNRDFEPKGVDLYPPGGSLWEGEVNGNYCDWNATIPVTIPGSISGNYGKSHPYQQCPKNSFKRLYIVKGLLVLAEKLHFRKNFDENFNTVDRVSFAF